MNAFQFFFSSIFNELSMTHNQLKFYRVKNVKIKDKKTPSNLKYAECDVAANICIY